MGLLLFENRKLEIKENYNSYNEIDDRKIVSKRGGSFDYSIIRLFDYFPSFLLSVYGRTTDALASVGYEGRGRLR